MGNGSPPFGSGYSRKPQEIPFALLKENPFALLKENSFPRSKLPLPLLTWTHPHHNRCL
jgi:hypothetical protein